MSKAAVIAGVGPGLGESLARKFTDEHCNVGLFARSEQFITSLATDLGEQAIAIPADITDESDVRAGFEKVRDAYGPVDILVNHASGGAWKGTQEITPDEFDQSLAVSARGALLCSQEALTDMTSQDDGTIIFTGATSAIRGRDGAIGFSAAKFAARGMAESMARELGPHGIHVAHVVIDGQIKNPRTVDTYPDRDEETFLDPRDIADAYWQLITQNRSAWTLELDLRPHVEPF